VKSIAIPLVGSLVGALLYLAVTAGLILKGYKPPAPPPAKVAKVANVANVANITSVRMVTRSQTNKEPQVNYCESESESENNLT
jgi:4-amino-4-deoxy-L-arabinose transferase-like glycosyltransferase